MRPSRSLTRYSTPTRSRCAHRAIANTSRATDSEGVAASTRRATFGNSTGHRPAVGAPAGEMAARDAGAVAVTAESVGVWQISAGHRLNPSGFGNTLIA